MRLLLLFSFTILLSSAFFTIPAYDSGILEILIESEAPIHAGFVVTYKNKSHVTWRHLKPNIPELLIFEGFDLFPGMNQALMNVTIHDNITSNSVVFQPANKPVYDINKLPLPYTGLQMKFKCAEDWYGILCHQHCFVKNERWRCDENGNPACAQGYCGWNCLKSGSDCPVFANCSCQNGGECYNPLSESSTKCHCPAGYLGDDCGFFHIIESKLDLMTNFGANLTVQNKFSNRADIYQLFEKNDEKLRASRHQDAQKYQSFETFAAICVLIWLVATTGYCIIKCCGKSEKDEKKIVETFGDEKKKTSEEEKKCILIEMNNM